MLNKLFISLLIFISLYQFTQAQKGNNDPFEAAVMKNRTSKNEEYRMVQGSPLEPSDIPGFKGLKYYPYNAKYRVVARVQKIKNPVVFKMKTTTDRRPEYKAYADLIFTIDGVHCKLTVYQPVSHLSDPGFEKYLFLPFTDETSGRETYGGGRFIDLSIPEGDTLLLDFNTAYNPLCAYNHRYSCPVPPEENDLKVKIEAGEKPLKDLSAHK
ncbi:MAG: DUF1684 domain-containing protein [Bacteroidetes bacterium]|nr:DUF1684 domain-containing protein [Bacteroidota bacterium]